MKKIFSLITGLMMIAVTLSVTAGTISASEGPAPAPNAPYPVFRIDSNAEFPAHASSGNGGDTTPWIIENKEVNGTGFGYGVYIGNTTEHFILRNCTITGAGGVGSTPYYPDAGMIIYNVSKGNVVNCTFLNNEGSGILISSNARNVSVSDSVFTGNLDGIETWDIRNSRIRNVTSVGNNRYGTVMRDSQNLLVNNSQFSNNLEGVRMFYVNGTTFSMNSATDNTLNGVTMNATNNNYILNNTLSLNGANGIEIRYYALNGSTVNEVTGNDANNNTQAGMAIVGAATQLNSLHNNSISDNGAGVLISGSNNNTVVDNLIYSNAIGVSVASANNNSVYHNDFIGNTDQASDSGANQWNDAYPSGGNFWNDYSGVDILSGPLQDQPGSDGIGDTPYIIDADTADNYPLWPPTEIDFIRIMDGPNGTGSAVPASVYPSPWFNITLWAVGWNASYNCYVRDVFVNWTNVNYSGAKSTVTNTSGYSTTWQAGPDFGGALLTANYTTGMTRSVNITIAAYLPDIMIDGKTDNAYENPPVSQISWENMSQGGSSAFDIVAENDGATVGTFTLLWDISGLPGTFCAVMLNDDLHTNVTASMGTGNAFNLNPSARMNFTLYINSSTTAGFGQMGTVNIGLFPPTGPQDSAGAIAAISEPDFIVLTDSPDGTELTGSAILVGDQITAYASAYNDTGPTYLGIVPVDWSASPTLGTFNNATGTSSTFTATSVGTATVTGTSIGLGLSDTYTVIITSTSDTQAPTIEDISNLTGTTGEQFAVRANVQDNVAVDEVYIEYWFGSGDPINYTMGGNPRTFPIDVPLTSLEVLHYIISAVDTAGNWNTTVARNVIITDNDAPLAIAGPNQTVDAGTTVDFDGADSIDNIEIANYTWTFTHNGTSVTLFGSEPEFRFGEVGTHTVTLQVSDSAGNSDMDGVEINVIEPVPPVADAGSYDATVSGTEVTFDGSASADDMGILNYTWTFSYNDTAQTLFGMAPKFTFWTPGEYSVTLTVRDGAGLTDSDIAAITVTAPEMPEDDDGWPSEYCWVIFIIIIVTAVLLLLVLLKGRKKKQMPNETVPEVPPMQEPANTGKN